MEFHINQVSLHHIDIDKQEIKEFENVALEKNFNEYINNILLKLFDSKTNHRFFEIKSNSWIFRSDRATYFGQMVPL